MMMMVEEDLHELVTEEGNLEKKGEEEDHHEGEWGLGRCWEGGCAQTWRWGLMAGQRKVVRRDSDPGSDRWVVRDSRHFGDQLEVHHLEAHRV